MTYDELMQQLGRQSTGPQGLTMGDMNAPGAWDGGYNATYQDPPPRAQQAMDGPMNEPPSQQQATSAATQAAPAAALSAPDIGSADWLMSLSDQDRAHYSGNPNYGNSTMLSQLTPAQLDSMAQSAGASYNNEHPVASAPLVDGSWGQIQQTFTANNPAYGTTGYWGNQAQADAQMAEHAQANSIPTGVLGTSFGVGGADYGGTQTAQNTASGNNGATNWTGSTYGVPAADPGMSAMYGGGSGIADPSTSSQNPWTNPNGAAGVPKQKQSGQGTGQDAYGGWRNAQSNWRGP